MITVDKAKQFVQLAASVSFSFGQARQAFEENWKLYETTALALGNDQFTFQCALRHLPCHFDDKLRYKWSTVDISRIKTFKQLRTIVEMSAVCKCDVRPRSAPTTRVWLAPVQVERQPELLDSFPEWMNDPQLRGIWMTKEDWVKISSVLSTCPINAGELEDAIISYKPSIGKLHAVHEYERLYPGDLKLLPFIVSVALELPQLFNYSNLTQRHLNDEWIVELTQRQATCLVANAFLCTFPERRLKTYLYFTFSSMFRSAKSVEKIRFIFAFFKQRSRLLDGSKSGDKVVFKRHRLQGAFDFAGCQSRLSNVTFKQGTIEDEDGALQMDFANVFIGGGVLRGGAVQEEIRFLISPDLIAAMAFTECLQSRDVFIADGVQRISNYTGYGSNLAYNGEAVDQTKTTVVAADALPFRGKPSDEQFHPAMVERELVKAYAAFKNWDGEHPLPPVATGNWGCGAFAGDPVLKFAIQLVAASAARRPLTYVLFRNDDLQEKLTNLYGLLKQCETVGAAFRALMDACKTTPADFRETLNASLQIDRKTGWEEKKYRHSQRGHSR